MKTPLTKLLLIFATVIALLQGAQIISPLSWSDFYNSFEFWRNTLILGVFLSFLLGTTGFWLVAQRSVYSGLALSSSSVVGLLTAAFLMDQYVHLPHSLLLIAGMTLGILLYLGGIRFLKHSVGGDSATAVIYVACTAATILISNNTAQGHHELENFLFGNSVTVTNDDFLLSALLSWAFILLSFYFVKKWLTLIFDPLFDFLTHSRSNFHQLLLQVTIAAALVIGAKNFGMLTTFSILLFPALIAYLMAKSGRQTSSRSGLCATQRQRLL